MKTISISQSQARRIALNAQLLDGRTKLPKGKEGVARTIELLGYIQIDTIAVIERAHHHTLWNRRPDYKQTCLKQLQEKDRRIFEYWGHAASYLPMTDYRYCIKRMRGFADPHGKWEKQRLEKYGHMMGPVFERIKSEGPLGSKDFKPPDGVRQGAWWNWRPAKVALELLFWRGELMITGRKNFHRLYDVTERVLPDWVDTTEPTDDEQGKWLVTRALNAYGVATGAEIRNHIYGFAKLLYDKALGAMIETGEVAPVSVSGVSNSTYFVLTDQLERLSKLRKVKPRLYLLSPFDNLIIQRERTGRLFDFDYTIECYVPSAKRQYGYFVLPILWGERLIGRIDTKADRKSKSLIVRALFLEDSFSPDDAFWNDFGQTLRRFAAFNACDTIKTEASVPNVLRKQIASAILS